MLTARVLAGGGLSAPVVAGDAFVGPDRPRDLAIVHEDSTGYDGQFVYRLALDPFTRTETAYGITLDNAPYRQQRVGLPLLANALDRAGIPLSLALLLVNAAALVAAAAAGAALARRQGRHALWGLLVALSPGLVVAANRNLTEPLQMAFLLWGLVAWTSRRPVLATAAFTAAVFTRETSIVVLFGLGLWEAYRALRGPGRRAAAARGAMLFVPVATFAAWQAHLHGVWGEVPVRANDGNVGTPFARWATSFLAGGGDWSDWTTTDALLAHLWVGERLVLATVLAVTAISLARSTVGNGTKIGWAVAALLALSVSWTRDVAFLRAANEAIVLAVVVLLGARTRAATAALAGTAALSVTVGGLYALAL